MCELQISSFSLYIEIPDAHANPSANDVTRVVNIPPTLRLDRSNDFFPPRSSRQICVPPSRPDGACARVDARGFGGGGGGGEGTRSTAFARAPRKWRAIAAARRDRGRSSVSKSQRGAVATKKKASDVTTGQIATPPRVMTSCGTAIPPRAARPRAALDGGRARASATGPWRAVATTRPRREPTLSSSTTSSLSLSTSSSTTTTRRRRRGSIATRAAGGGDGRFRDDRERRAAIDRLSPPSSSSADDDADGGDTPSPSRSPAKSKTRPKRFKDAMRQRDDFIESRLRARAEDAANEGEKTGETDPRVAARKRRLERRDAARSDRDAYVVSVIRRELGTPRDIVGGVDGDTRARRFASLAAALKNFSTFEVMTGLVRYYYAHWDEGEASRGGGGGGDGGGDDDDDDEDESRSAEREGLEVAKSYSEAENEEERRRLLRDAQLRATGIEPGSSFDKSRLSGSFDDDGGGETKPRPVRPGRRVDRRFLRTSFDSRAVNLTF